jgi:hypothetical protein
MPTYDHGVAGLTGTIGVTVLNADGTAHDARATAGITEPVAGSGIYHIAHPHPGTLLLFMFDGGVGTVGGSCWDDGLTTMPARAGDAMTLTAAYDAAKAAASQVSVNAIPTTPLLAADYPVPASWATITHATVADDGSGALGPVKVGGVLTAGVLVEAILADGTVKNSTTTDGDGEFSLAVPHGAAYSVRFSYDGKVSESKVVTTA